MQATRGSRSPEPGVDELVTAVLTASRVLVGVAARSLEVVAHSVTPTQFRTLVVLHTRGGTNLNGLAERLGVTASSAVRMVDKLVAQRLVNREGNPGNRREVQLRLTPEGTALVDEVTARRRTEIATIVSAMPHERRGELVAALSAFAQAAEEPPADEVTALGW